jgi:hypothetical protein
MNRRRKLRSIEAVPTPGTGSRSGSDIAPTLVIPQGTRIEVDASGQLSVYAPGNLVLQNSGSYGTLEAAGSIRIDRGVEVEAVHVVCAETCFVQGSLTCWKVTARTLHLDDTARVHVVLQETPQLEVGRDARLVGAFGSESELFHLFARFAHQVRTLPFTLERRTARRELQGAEAVPDGTDAGTDAGTEKLLPPLGELPEPLLFALVLVERELEMKLHGPAAQRALGEIVKLLQGQDLETLRHTYRLLFSRVAEPRADVVRARELVTGYYDPP